MRDKRRIEWLVPAALAGVLVVHCVIASSAKRFWGDELCTYYELHDPSFTHMLGAQADKINATPPTYFLIGWPLAHVLGSDELTLRMFSCVGVIIALAATWWMLREVFGFWPASVAVAVGFLGSNLVLDQASEARFYGLLLAEVSIALQLALQSITRPSVGPKLLVANALTHAALVTTHYFGWLYSVAILIVMAMFLVGDKRRLIKCVGSGMLGWLAFLPWIPAFVHHLQFAKTRGWIPRPGMAGVFALLKSESANYGPAALLILGVAFVLQRIVPETRDERMSRDKNRRHKELVLVALMGALLAVPIVAWARSRISEPMLVDRYVLADVMFWSLAFAYLVHDTTWCLRVATTDRRHRVATWTTRIAFSFLIIWYAGMAIFPIMGKRAPNLPNLRAGGVAGKPIVAENLNFFLPLQHYSGAAADYRFVLDREAALAAPDGSPNTQFQIGEAFHRQYPELAIQTTDELLSERREFVVIDSPNHVWFERRIQNNPKFTCKELPEMTAQLKEFEQVANDLRVMLVSPVEAKTTKENREQKK